MFINLKDLKKALEPYADFVDTQPQVLMMVVVLPEFPGHQFQVFKGGRVTIATMNHDDLYIDPHRDTDVVFDYWDHVRSITNS